MWDLYTRRNAGIAIQTTYARLSESLETNHEDEVYIGIVIYIDQEKEWHRVWSQSEVLVRKRISFEHEQELRAVTFQSQLTDLGKYVSVDLGILIEKIYVAPKAPRYFEDGIKSIAERFNIDKELVVKSDLYSPKWLR
jgi:hypothetical protein